MLTSSQHSHDLARLKALSVVADILTKPLTREKVETIHPHFR
jgi:hypothetical protein